MKSNRSLQRIGQSVLTIVAIVMSIVGLVGRTQAQGPAMGDAIAASNQDLLRRLEAAEAELHFLRSRDQQRAVWEQSIAEQLPAIPANYTADNTLSIPVAYHECVCGCCGDTRPICQNAGPLGKYCGESLAWTKGPWQIVPFGFLTGEAISTTSSTRARPFIMYMSDARSASEQFTIHGQTTALGFNFSGPCVGSFQLGGMILFNFLGDRPALNQATPFFLRGYGELKNDYWRFTFGQQGDLFNPLNPITVNFGGNKQAGNGGSFRGSFRAERFIRPSDIVQWTLQTAIGQQVVTDFVVDPRIVGNDNGWPNVEGRVALGLGQTTASGRPFEVGVSGVIGETSTFGIGDVLLGTQGAVYTTWGVSADLQFRTERWGINGELAAGQALGTYNLAIGQSLDPLGLGAIRTVGGWGDIWYKLTPCLTTHVGYGIDDPNNEDVGQFLDADLNPAAGQRSRNEVVWANLIWDVNKSFDVAFEISHRETDYIAPSVSNSGMIYHFRSRIRF